MKIRALVTFAFLWVVSGGLALAGPQADTVKPETAAQVRKSVEKYVKQENQLKGGFFLRGAESKDVRDLQFDYVHEGVKKTAADQYYVCVDFLDSAKKRLDVDFYLKPAAAGEFEITEIKVHKIDGVAQK